MRQADVDWRVIPVILYPDAVQDGKAPLYVGEIDIDGTNNIIVRCADGSLGRLQQVTLPGAAVQGVPKNKREYLREWLERVEPAGKFPATVMAFKRKLLNDIRMREFWDWFERIEYKSSRYLQSSLSVTDSIWRSTKLPGKPGNMTPAQRAAYFTKVRSLAHELRDLLYGTRFDNPLMTELSESALDRALEKELDSWGDDESDEGHTVAFQVTPDGVFRHHYDYPDNVLTETLFNVVEWTCWEDQWDGGVFSTSAPIAQANSESTPIIYFCCTLHDRFRERGVEMPFAMLATVANVALDLPVHKQADEDAVRKQVRRYQQRLARQRVGRPETFDGPTGQNSSEPDDSVLFPPF